MTDMQTKPENRLSESEQRYLYNLAVKNFKTGNYRRALPIFQYLVIEKSDSYLYLKSLAACYYGLKNYWLALITYQQSLASGDQADVVECYYYMGVCHFEVAGYPAAKIAFETYLDKSPNNLILEKKARLYLEAIVQIGSREIDDSVVVENDDRI